MPSSSAVSILDVLHNCLTQDSVIGRTLFSPLGRKIRAVPVIWRFGFQLLCLAGIMFSRTAAVYSLALFICYYLALLYSAPAEQNEFNLRYRKILALLAETTALWLLIRYTGWQAHTLLLVILNSLLLFLYFYSAIAFLLILPPEIRKQFTGKTAAVNKEFLSRPGFFRYDKDFFLLLMAVLVCIPGLSINSALVILFCTGGIVWFIQIGSIWQDIKTYAYI